MAGSLGLNTRFTEAVHNLVGDKQWATLEKSVGWFKAQEEFDKVIKLAFRGDTDEDFYVSFPQAKLQDDPIENLVGNCWTMTGMDVEDIFDPLVWDVLGLINDQVKKAQLARRGKGVKVGKYQKDQGKFDANSCLCTVGNIFGRRLWLKPIP